MNSGHNTTSESKSRLGSSERKGNSRDRLMKMMKTRRMSLLRTRLKSGTEIFIVSCISNIRERTLKGSVLILQLTKTLEKSSIKLRRRNNQLMKVLHDCSDLFV